MFRIAVISVFSLAGAFYSGVLAFSKLTTGICAFGASCPYLFNLPVCVYGFVGFVFVFLLSMMAMFNERKRSAALHIIYWFSFVGTLFALFYLIQELFFLPTPPAGRGISLGYPSCLYGMIGYLVAYLTARSIVTTKV